MTVTVDQVRPSVIRASLLYYIRRPLLEADVVNTFLKLPELVIITSPTCSDR